MQWPRGSLIGRDGLVGQCRVGDRSPVTVQKSILAARRRTVTKHQLPITWQRTIGIDAALTPNRTTVVIQHQSTIAGLPTHGDPMAFSVIHIDTGIEFGDTTVTRKGNVQ